ncbi:MAG TPA: hypothetical protein VGQ91_05430, partial [Ideonella sp.]|nr:hypothetical protein [Ideonella sp.]
MLDQGLVRSGFDAEILIGARQFSYALIALVDAGQIPTQLQVGPKLLSLLAPREIDRTYEPNPDAPFDSVSGQRDPFEVEILFDHPLGADLRVHPVLGLDGLEVDADLFVVLTLSTTNDELGMLATALLHLEVVDLDSPILPFIESQFGIDKATILAEIKLRVDRDIDLASFGDFKRLQDLAVRKLPATEGHPSAFGIFVNLRLQQGPEPLSLKPTRGSVDEAVNFLPEGSDAAMASRPGLYADMAKDAFERLAEIDAQGHVSHPWHKSIHNPDSEVIGKIKGVSVRPLRPQDGGPGRRGGEQEPPKTLRIDVHVEYQIDDFFDPDGHLVINLTPVANEQGILVWSIDADFHASLLLEIIGFLVLASIFTGIGGIIGLGLGAAIAGGLIAGSLVDAAGHAIVDEVYSGRVEKKVDAGLPDVISGRVEVAQRRWDPFYTTHHQVALRPDGAIVNDDGVALWGRAAIDKRIVPVDHVVIRDKFPAPPTPATHLRYRVFDVDQFGADFAATAPGTDRRDFAQHDPVAEPTLFQLDLEQIKNRMGEGRIVPDLAYLPQYVDIRQNQVHSILTVSNREFNEVRGGLIFTFESSARPIIEAEQGEQIRQDVIAEFEDEGVTPTEEEIVARVQARIDAILAEQTTAYTDSALFATQLEQALRPLLKLDLPPENFAAVQQQGILHLLGLEIITMRSGLRYYRDRPDFNLRDNLMSLP